MKCLSSTIGSCVAALLGIEKTLLPSHLCTTCRIGALEAFEWSTYRHPRVHLRGPPGEVLAKRSVSRHHHVPDDAAKVGVIVTVNDLQRHPEAGQPSVIICWTILASHLKWNVSCGGNFFEGLIEAIEPSYLLYAKLWHRSLWPPLPLLAFALLCSCILLNLMLAN